MLHFPQVVAAAVSFLSRTHFDFFFFSLQFSLSVETDVFLLPEFC